MTSLLYFDNASDMTRSSKRRDFNVKRLKEIVSDRAHIVAPYSCKPTLHDGGLDEQFDIVTENPNTYAAIIINQESRGFENYLTLAEMAWELDAQTGLVLLQPGGMSDLEKGIAAIRPDAHIARCNMADVAAALKPYLK